MDEKDKVILLKDVEDTFNEIIHHLELEKNDEVDSNAVVDLLIINYENLLLLLKKKAVVKRYKKGEQE